METRAEARATVLTDTIVDLEGLPYTHSGQTEPTCSLLLRAVIPGSMCVGERRGLWYIGGEKYEMKKAALCGVRETDDTSLSSVR